MHWGRKSLSLFRKSRNIQAIIENIHFTAAIDWVSHKNSSSTSYSSLEGLDFKHCTGWVEKELICLLQLLTFSVCPLIYSSHFIKVYYYYPMPFSPLSSLMGTFINDDKIAFLQSVHFFIFHSFQALKMDFISLPVVR